MKKPLIAFLTISFLLSNTVLAQSGRSSYGSCSFLCDNIPSDDKVLHSMGQASLPTLNSTRLNILSWNLYKGRQENFKNAYAKLSRDRDIVMLSEATTGSPVVDALKKQVGFEWHLAAAFNMKNDVATGTAIGSKARPYNVHFYRTKDVEPFVKSPKAVTVVEYAIPGSDKKLLALSIHGINFSGNDGLANQLNMILPELKKHDGPIVFAGDFNTKNKERLEIAQKILGQAGLKRVPWQNPMKKKQLNEAFTRGVKVQKARLIHDFVDNGSDHPAIELIVDVIL